MDVEERPQLKGMNEPPTLRSIRQLRANAGSPTAREGQGDGAPIVVAGVTPGRGGRESRPQGEGAACESRPESMLGTHGQGRCLPRPNRGGTRDAKCRDGPG